MKFIIKLSFACLTFVATVLVIALFLKKDYSITRSIEIECARSDVFEYVKLLDHQMEFAEWLQCDPESGKIPFKQDGEVGCVMRWDSSSEPFGKGEQEILWIEEEERIDCVVRFIEPRQFEVNSSASFSTTETGKTEVKWTFEGSLDYPFNIMMLFSNMENFVDLNLEQSLKNLKQILESAN